MPQIARKIAIPWRPWSQQAIAPGAHTRAVPPMGRRERTAIAAPARKGDGRPAIAQPTPPAAPWISAVRSEPRKIDWSIPLRDPRSADPAFLLERDQVEERPHHLPAVAEQEEEEEERHQEGQDRVEQPHHDSARDLREEAGETGRELTRLRQHLGRREAGPHFHPGESVPHGRDPEQVVQPGHLPGGERRRRAPDDADRLVHEDAQEEARREDDEQTDGEGQENRREAPAASASSARGSATARRSRRRGRSPTRRPCRTARGSSPRARRPRTRPAGRQRSGRCATGCCRT